LVANYNYLDSYNIFIYNINMKKKILYVRGTKIVCNTTANTTQNHIGSIKVYQGNVYVTPIKIFATVIDNEDGLISIKGQWRESHNMHYFDKKTNADELNNNWRLANWFEKKFNSFPTLDRTIKKKE